MARLATAIAVAIALALVGAPPAQGARHWVWPLRGQVITHYRNGDDPYAGGQHRGIDIAGRVGAPVVSAAAGVVRFAGTAGYSGLTVGVRTADGRYDTSYLHLSSIAVRRGQRLAAGERLGAAGTTGRPSSARPHLHFGVRDAGSRHAYHDPLDFLPPPARPRPAPRGTPAPVGAPARPSPVPLEQPAPRGLRRRAPHRAPRALPRGLPGRVPRPLPSLRPVPGLPGVPAAARRQVPARRGAPEAPEADPAAASAPATRPVPLPRSAHRRPHDDAAPGPNLGWALACLGLLLAAALMGTRTDRRGSPRGLPARLGAWLRPLAGRG
jgi:hypothetical protein